MYFTAPTLSNWKRLILQKSNGGIDSNAFGAWIRRYDPKVFCRTSDLATLGFIVGNVVSRRIDGLVRPNHFAFAPVLMHDGGGLAGYD